MPPLLTPAPVGTPGSVAQPPATITNPTTLLPDTGSGYAVGDTLLCFTACRAPTPTVATPPGWTQILNITGGNARIALYAKAAASTTEPAPSVVWSGTTLAGYVTMAIVAAFTNLDITNLAAMADVVGASADGNASLTATVGGAALTTLADKDLVLTLTMRQDDVFTSYTPPAGFANVTPPLFTASGSDMAMAWAYQVKTPAGAIAAPTFAVSGAVSSTGSTGVMVALKARQLGTGFVDAPSGTLLLSGSCTDLLPVTIKYTDKPFGTIALSGGVAATSALKRSWGGLVRELPPLRHHVDAIAPNGRHYRWADDEPDAQNVPGNLRWGSTMPGGYESCDCVLPRKPGVDYADLERLTTLRIIGAGGGVFGEYRLERTPQTSGDQMAISPSAVGWQAHLDDNKGVSIVFIDRELGGWVGPNSQRRLAQLTGLNDPVDPSSTQGDDGLPSLKMGIEGAWARRANCEAFYFLPSGDAAGRVKFDFQAAASINIADANWVGDIYAATGDGYSTLTQLTPADWLNAMSGSVSADATAVPFGNRTALMIRLYYATGPGGADNTAYDTFLRNLRVFGNHNLTVRGTSAGKEGFFASDMIAFALKRWAPLLKVAPVPNPGTDAYVPAVPFSDWIQPTTFVIPQAKFIDTTVGEIVKQTTRFGLEDWAVWNDKTFYLSQRNGSPLAKRWRARIGPAKLEETGKQVDRLWESIIVQFSDVDGSSRTVGPPGSGADVESSYLKDTDPDNPANVLGIIRRDKLAMGTSTFDGAIEVGRRFLEEQKLIDRSGRATLVGHVEDDHGVLFPYSQVQAGDAITFVDASDTSYRRIVKADHDERSKSATVDLDAPPEGLQAVLERLAVVLVPLGL
jgi:hypothetical protein